MSSITQSNPQIDKVIDRKDEGAPELPNAPSGRPAESSQTELLDGFQPHVVCDGATKAAPFSGSINQDSQQQSADQLQSARIALEQPGQDSLEAVGHAKAKSTVEVVARPALKEALAQGGDAAAIRTLDDEPREEAGASEQEMLVQNDDQSKDEEIEVRTVEASRPKEEQADDLNEYTFQRQRTQSKEEDTVEEAVKIEDDTVDVRSDLEEEEVRPDHVGQVDVQKLESDPKNAGDRDDQGPAGLAVMRRVPEDPDDGTVEYEGEQQHGSTHANDQGGAGTGRSNPIDVAASQHLELGEADQHHRTYYIQAQENEHMDAVQLDFS